MPKFRKKPVVIEAIQFNNMTDYLDIAKWMVESGSTFEQGFSYPEMWVQTLEGQMTARPGDWIIKGVAGEFYPCKDPIFRQTYDLEPQP